MNQLSIFVLVLGYFQGAMSNDGGSIQFSRDGCWRDEKCNNALPDLLITEKYPVINANNSTTIDWANFPQYLANLVQLCAEKANEKNQMYFGLQFYGECWSGSTDPKRYDVSTECVNDQQQPCTVNDEYCVGKTNAFALYVIARVCGNLQRQVPGSLTSPNFPEVYDQYLDCTWMISARVGKRISVKFPTFLVETSTDCIYDYLDIYDGPNTDSTKLGRYCGENIPVDFISSGADLVLVFCTDDTIQHSGFNITYTEYVLP